MAWQDKEDEMWDQWSKGNHEKALEIHEDLDRQEALDKTMDAVKDAVEFETNIPGMMGKSAKGAVVELSKDAAEDLIEKAKDTINKSNEGNIDPDRDSKNMHENSEEDN